MGNHQEEFYTLGRETRRSSGFLTEEVLSIFMRVLFVKYKKEHPDYLESELDRQLFLRGYRDEKNEV